MNDPTPTRIAFDHALEILREVADAHRLERELLALPRCHGRVLAADVVAPIALPTFDNSAMDGFAFRHADLDPDNGGRLRLAGEQFAGVATGQGIGAGECLGITTGAPMPPGADTVAIIEDCTREADHVSLPGKLPPGANVRRAGEDVAEGERVLRAGQVLTPMRVSLAAALGIESLQVSRRPTVAVFTTGDELVPPGMPLAPGQIHDSNRELLAGLLRAEGLEPTLWPALPDDPGRIEFALRDAACAFDIVLTCGGVSAGGKDHVPSVLSRFGSVHFWKVRMKPGMPLLFGSMDQARLLGLPGNPVSVLATWMTFGRALADGLQGRTEPRPALRARLSVALSRTHPRREFQRARLEAREDGGLWAIPDPVTGSHRLRAASMADVLLVVPEGPCELPVGMALDVLPLQ